MVAIPSFRTRGDYLAIITLAVNYIVKSAIENIQTIGGARGFMGMSRVVNGMKNVADVPWMMIWTWISVFITLLLIKRFVSSTYGKGIIAIREDEIAAEIMGVNTRRAKMVAFMLSSGLAGVAGGLIAHILGYINPGSFTIMKSTEALVMVYLGGMGSLSGSVLSAVFFTLMLEVLRPLQVIKWVVVPLILFLLMMFRTEGLLGQRELTDVFPRLKRIFGDKEGSVPLFEIRGLTHFFGGLKAVSDFNLAFQGGELAGLIGPNGAGKTTIFNLVCGVYRPSHGEIRIQGRNAIGLFPHQVTGMGIARTFQNIRLWPEMTVLDNIRVAHNYHLGYGLLSCLTTDFPLPDGGRGNRPDSPGNPGDHGP